LRSAPPVFGVTEAERVARELYGLAVTVSSLSGERDCNFHARTADGQEYVLKIVDGAADPRTTECQVRVLRHIAEQDPTLAVPRLHATMAGADLGSVTRDGLTYSSCLLSYLPGRLLSDCAPDRSLLKNVGVTLARIDRALRGFFHPALAQHIAWDVRRLPELLEFARCITQTDVRRNVESVIRVVQDRLPVLRSLRAQAIHGDCHGGNLLIDAASGTVCGVLDFGDMIHGPLILEPAVAMSELLTEAVTDAAALSTLLEGYALEVTLDSADVAVLFDLVAGRHAVTILLHAWRAEYGGGAAILDKAADTAASSLDWLLGEGREALSREWHHAAGTAVPKPASIDLGRRQRLLGVGAELFYERPLHMVRGDGVWLYDREGRAYLDGYNNVPHVGHCHPTVVRAIQRQTSILATNTRYLHERVLEYAEHLLARCPPHLNACIFVNSGSEANDVAWRIAQLATGHGGALIMANAYHGITDAVAALTPGSGQPDHHDHVVVLPPPPEGLRAGDAVPSDALSAAVESTDRAIRSLAGRGWSPAAFFIDTAMTSSGIYDPPPAWADAVTTRIRAAGALIVADEVQYGLGRSGSHFWGYERRGMLPDMITLGKPMGNGYPMGAVIANRQIIEAFQAKSGFFSTFGGNPVAASAGLAVLEVIERERLTENAAATGAYLRRALEGMAARHDCLGLVRGSGLLLGLEVKGHDRIAAARRAKSIVNALASRSRILIGTDGPAANILKIRPPLPFRPEHADLMAEAIDAAATATRGNE